MTKIKMSVVALGLCLAVDASAKEDLQELKVCSLWPVETKSQKDARMKWWADSRFGMFIHFGLYAMPGRHEWVRRNEKIPGEVYDSKYFARFNPDLFDARKWVRAAKSAGMKYIILTAKHHEGFCLWDSAYTDYKITKTPFGRDLVREYVDACHEEGIRVGLYYSIIDWHHPNFKIDSCYPNNPVGQPDAEKKLAELNKGRDMVEYRKYMMDQISELLTNYGKIDIAFFDFTYKTLPTINQPSDYHSEEVLALVRKLQPGIIVNDRLGLSEYVGGWDMKTPEQVNLTKCPTFNGEEIYWETCQTFSGSWGYYRDEETWKSPRQLIGMLVESVSMKGNLLLNVGPTARGEFDWRAKERLAAMGEWMHFNSRSIYGCTAAPEDIPAPKGTCLTYNPDTRRLYVHILEWPIKVLPIDFADKVAYAQLLHDGSEVEIKQPRNVAGQLRTDIPASLILPVKKPNVEIPVVEMFLK